MSEKRPKVGKLRNEAEKAVLFMNGLFASESSKLLMLGVEQYAKTDKLTAMRLKDFKKAREDFEFVLRQLSAHFDAVEKKENVIIPN